MKKEEKRQELKDQLKKYLKLCKNEKGYNNIKRGVKITFSDLKASKSGLSRTFKMYLITKKGETLNITWLVSQILQETYTNEGKIRVYGCGMDMLFNTCYNLNCALYRLDGHKKYNHDKAYHGYVDTSYNLL